MFDHNTLVEAGLKPRHVSRLVGVSRVTASNWLRGVARPHKLIQDKANLLQQAVELGVESGELPVSTSLGPEETSVKTVSVVRRNIKIIEEDQNKN